MTTDFDDDYGVRDDFDGRLQWADSHEVDDTSVPSRAENLTEQLEWLEAVLSNGARAQREFSKLYTSLRGFSLSVAHRYTAIRDDAASIVDEAWAHLWQKWAVEKDRPEQLLHYVRQALQWYGLKHNRAKKGKDRKFLTYDGALASDDPHIETEEDGDIHDSVYVDRGGFAVPSPGHLVNGAPYLTTPFDPTSEELERDETAAIVSALIGRMHPRRHKPLHALLAGEPQASVSSTYCIPTSTLNRWITELKDLLAAHVEVKLDHKEQAARHARRKPSDIDFESAARSRAKPDMPACDTSNWTAEDWLAIGVSDPRSVGAYTEVGDINTGEDLRDFLSRERLLHDDGGNRHG